MNHKSNRRQAMAAMLAATGAAGPHAGAMAQAVAAAGAPATKAGNPAGRVVFGIPPGAAGTTLARALIAELTPRLGRQMQLDHVLGRDGRRSVEVTVSSAPDGLTLLHAQSSLITLFPAIYNALGYSPLEDLAPIAALSEYAFMLLVGPRVPARVQTLDDYAQWVKDTPSGRQIGVILRGSQGWMLTRSLADARDVPLQAVSYAGGAPIVDELAAGGLAAGIVVTGNAAALRQAGTLRALAVSSEQRWMGMPEVPTFTELGLRDMAMSGWYGWFGPASLPEATQQRLHTAVNEAMASEPMQKVLATLSMPAAGWSRGLIRERIRLEIDQTQAQVQRTGMTRI